MELQREEDNKSFWNTNTKQQYKHKIFKETEVIIAQNHVFFTIFVWLVLVTTFKKKEEEKTRCLSSINTGNQAYKLSK